MDVQDYLHIQTFYYDVFLINEKRVLDNPTSKIDLINYAITSYHFAKDYLGITKGLDLLERLVNSQKHKIIQRNGKPIYFDSLAKRRECYKDIHELMKLPQAAWDMYVFQDEHGAEHDLFKVLFDARLIIFAFLEKEQKQHNLLPL